MVHVEVSDKIMVPMDKLYALMSDYTNWPKLFSQYTDIRLIRKEGDTEYVELGDKRYGKVTEAHRVIPPDRIDIEEFTPNWRGVFVNLFEPSPGGGTILTLKVDITGQGFLKLLAPFSRGYIRRRVKKEIYEELRKNAPSLVK